MPIEKSFNSVIKLNPVILYLGKLGSWNSVAPSYKDSVPRKVYSVISLFF